MRKSRSRALRRQRWGKIASLFGVSPSVAKPKPKKQVVSRVVDASGGVSVSSSSPVARREGHPGHVAPAPGVAVAKEAGMAGAAVAAGVAVAAIEPSDLEALDQARDQSRRASRRAALFISLVLHVFVVVGLFFIVLPSREDPPQMVVAVPEKEYVEPETARKRKEESLPSAPTPKAAISLPKVLANLPSPVAAPEVDFLSKETLAPAAMPAMGLGMGRARMNFGSSLKGSAIGGLMVRSKKLGVVLDSSPSMTPFLPALRTEIRRNFRGSVFREIKGCTLRATNGRDSSAIVTFYDPMAVMMGIKALVQEHKVDAIYWFCDLQDPQTPEALDELEKLLSRGFPGRSVRFYVRSVDQKASSRLKSIIDRSGGEIEVGAVIN